MFGYAVLPNGSWPVIGLQLVEGGVELMFDIPPGHPLSPPSLLTIEDIYHHQVIIGMLNVSIDGCGTNRVRWTFRPDNGITPAAEGYLDSQWDELLDR